MKNVHRLTIALVLVFGLYSVYSNTHRDATHASPSVVHTAAAANASGKAGPTSLYPDATLTPGAELTQNAAIVCASGYASSVRNVPTSEKKHVFEEYGLAYPEPAGSYEVDHFISLELGGSNDIANLWPEPAEPKPGFHEKDKVEDYLHQQVCAGNMSLAEAQREISTDWYAVYLSIAR